VSYTSGTIDFFVEARGVKSNYFGNDLTKTTNTL